MATITGLTADRMLEIEDASIVDGDVIAGDLILTKHGGAQINAGSVIGPEGPQGPVASDIAVLTEIPVLDVGLVDQIRAGRQLGPADFGNIGLNAPRGLWNLSDLTDVSGNGRNLLNKGAVPFTIGINGIASTAALFSGSAAQAFYIADTGAADPFRIKSGSMGCWMRTAKRGVNQALITKQGTNSAYILRVENNNLPYFYVSIDGTAFVLTAGRSDIVDDRWHFIVGVFDGSVIRLYVDGVLEGINIVNGFMFSSSAPFNIGAASADAAVGASNPHFGCIDEAFVTGEVLTEDQIRNLYCAKIPHILATVPSRITLNIHRRRRGAALVSADFPTQPVRLHNFSAGSLGDEGSGNVALTNNGTALSVAGADGTIDNAFNFNGSQSLSSTDTGLPAGTTPRSYGGWIKSIATDVAIMGWGTISTNDITLGITGGGIRAWNGADSIIGPYISDGMWHHIVVTEENTPTDGIKRKLYVDGRLVGISLVLGSVTLAGANKFRIGSTPTGTSLFVGQLDGIFVTNYILTVDQIIQLFAKGTQTLQLSPKNPGDHIEGMTSTDLLAIFDTLDSQNQVDLGVAP